MSVYITATNVALKTSAASVYTKIIGSAGGQRYGTNQNDVFDSINKDILIGGLGDDHYNLWDAGSTVREFGSAGIDTIYVRYWGGITLSDNVENVFLMSKGANWATGNALSNIIVAGTTGATLNGGGGDDVLVGGAGADVFIVKAGNGSDAIDNFRTGWDTIKLEGYGIDSFAQLKAMSTQIGADVSIALSSTEKLVIHGIKVAALQASDFNFAMPIVTAPAGSLTLSAAASGWAANGWHVVNNAWGSSALKNGTDYSLTTTFNKADMTKGVTFNWSYDVNTKLTSDILAFPEVVFGNSPLNEAGHLSTDRANVFPLKVADIVSVTATHDTTHAGNRAGFNVAYDIFLSNTPNGNGRSAISNEVMVWLHKGSFEAFGQAIGTYTKGDFSGTIYHTGTYTAIVADSDMSVATIDIGDILLKLMSMGIVSSGEYLRSVELGAEIVSGTGSMTINDLDLRVESRNANGTTTVKQVGGSGTAVTEHAPVIDAMNAYKLGTQTIFDDNGFAAGKRVAVVDSAGVVTAKTTDLVGQLTGREVVTRDGTTITVKHFDGADRVSGIEHMTFKSDGSVVTQHFDQNWKLLSAERASTSVVGKTVTEHFDANWKTTGFEQVVDKGSGVVEHQQYDANWRVISADVVTTTGNTVVTQRLGANFAPIGSEKVTTAADGSITVQHFNATGVFTSADLIKTSNGATTAYHYNSKWALTGSDVTTVEASGVHKTLAFDAAYKQVATTFDGTDRADALYGWNGTTHFHGGLGSDTLVGGTGADFFYFDTAVGQGDIDRIRGFSVANDTIVLDDAIFATLGKPGALDPTMLTIGSVAKDANDHLIFDKTSGQLFYDVDGNGAQPQILIAHVAADAVLTSSDFLIG